MNKSKASHNLYDLSGLLISQMSPLSQRLCDCWYPPVKRVPVHIKKERQRGGRPSLNWRTFVAPDWTWKSNDITNKSRRLSDKEPLKSRSGKKVTFLHCWCTTGMSNLKVLDNLIKFIKKKKKSVSVSSGCTETWRGLWKTLYVAKSSIRNNNISSQTLSGHQVHSNYQWLKNDLLRRLGVRDQGRAQRRDTPLSCVMSFVNWSRFFLKRKRFIIRISHAPPGKVELSGNIKLTWDWK